MRWVNVMGGREDNHGCCREGRSDGDKQPPPNSRNHAALIAECLPRIICLRFSFCAELLAAVHQ